MAKTNICYHSLRLDMDREQHQRIEKVLAGLNTEIHKSVNQFMADAIDFYIHSLDGDTLVTGPERQQTEEYLTRKDLADIRREIKEEAGNEVLRLLGIVLAGGRIPAGEAVVAKASPGTEETGEAGDSLEAEGEHIMAELVSGWG